MITIKTGSSDKNADWIKLVANGKNQREDLKAGDEIGRAHV